jgi:3D (Asp-Asp-Asp) domain-containing protein
MKLSLFIALISLVISITAVPIQAAAPPLSNLSPATDKNPEVASVYEIEVWVTAYSSTPEETDETPFITASGKKVSYGIVAANFFDFGTKIKIPEIFGDKIFVVEDRMHQRKKNFIDIWMPTKEEAQKFGIVKTKIQVLSK